MKGVIRRGAAARQDLVDIYRRIARDAGFRASDRFLAPAESTIHRLGNMPGAGTRYEAENTAFGGLRFVPLASPFKKYIVFYRMIPGGIEIVRVPHGARDLPSILAAELGVPDDADDDPPGQEKDS
jgi:toxin ParE1/3/4